MYDVVERQEHFWKLRLREVHEVREGSEGAS